MFQNVNMLFVPFYEYIQTYSKVERIWQLTRIYPPPFYHHHLYLLYHMSIHLLIILAFIYFIFGAFQNKLQTSGHFPLNTSSILCFERSAFSSLYFIQSWCFHFPFSVYVFYFNFGLNPLCLILLLSILMVNAQNEISFLFGLYF